ncbi:MAG: Asp-tRNA(Asn)/Glu-tRNA(Gln) amidotransferase subunit GatA [Actinomycetota bacterium]
MALPCDQTASELIPQLRAGELSAGALVEEALDRIHHVDQQVGAYLTVTGEQALEQAALVDERLEAGEETPATAGIPIAIKDVFATKGVRTTCGSKILESYIPPYDATAWGRLREAGAAMVGKTNMDEFAMGSSNENSAYGPVHNPWDLDTVPGGSSGGSAAAVAAGEAVWALGSDTGGSVRQPAALCGVVGLKPTYGRISRYGLIAFASSLDHVGTFTRSVRDAALLLGAVAGHDPMDATSVDAPVPDYLEGLDAGVEGLRIGLVAQASGDGVQAAVRDAVRGACDRLQGLGAEVGEVSLPHTDAALSAYYLIAPSEASSNLARYDGVRYGFRADGEDSVQMMTNTRGAGFGPEVKRRIMLGTYALSAGYYDAYYGQAQKVRTLVIRDYEAAWQDFDVLISPTSPTTAFRIGERTEDPLSMYLSDVFTIPANFAGVPSISVPCGLDDAGLPIGLQLTAKILNEPALLRTANALEQDLGFAEKPPLIASLA